MTRLGRLTATLTVVALLSDITFTPLRDPLLTLAITAASLVGAVVVAMVVCERPWRRVGRRA